MSNVVTKHSIAYLSINLSNLHGSLGFIFVFQ